MSLREVSDEEYKLIEIYRKAKQERHAEFIVKIKDGESCAVQWTHKEDISALRTLKETNV